MAYIWLYDPYITPKGGSGPQVDGLHLELRGARHPVAVSVMGMSKDSNPK